MNFVESLDIFHVSAKEVPCLTGKGAPSKHTEGVPGVLYMDTFTGDLYKCRGGGKGAYRWEIQGSSTELTDAQKTELVAMVVDSLAGKVIGGYVDSANNIVINGLPDGSYTVKYEQDDGSLVDIGELQVGDVGPAYTNLAEPRPENTTDFDIWCSDARMGSSGAPATNAGYTCTNYFALSNGDVIRIKGFKIERVGLFNASKTALASGVSGLAALQTNNYIKADYSQTDDFTTFTANSDSIVYARLSGWVNTTADAVIITKNEEIT